MTETNAIVDTEHGVAYMKRLCKHFSHKLDVEIGDSVSTIHFPFGDCTITTSPTGMVFRVQVPNPAELDRAERVVGDHLVRMANKDEPVLKWSRTT